MRKPKLKENKSVIPGCSEIDDFLENLTEVLIIYACTVRHEIVPQLTGLHGNVLLASLGLCSLLSSLPVWFLVSLTCGVSGGSLSVHRKGPGLFPHSEGLSFPLGPKCKVHLLTKRNCIFSPRGTASSWASWQRGLVGTSPTLGTQG